MYDGIRLLYRHTRRLSYTVIQGASWARASLQTPAAANISFSPIASIAAWSLAWSTSFFIAATALSRLDGREAAVSVGRPAAALACFVRRGPERRCPMRQLAERMRRPRESRLGGIVLGAAPRAVPRAWPPGWLAGGLWGRGRYVLTPEITPDHQTRCGTSPGVPGMCRVCSGGAADPQIRFYRHPVLKSEYKRNIQYVQLYRYGTV
eukprot:COSAG05_NODE_8219_length_725_cov_1.579872_1_plen_207_part_00